MANNQSVFHLALASRGLAPTRIVREHEITTPRRSVLEPMKAWFVAVAVTLFALAGAGSSPTV